MSQSLYRKWRPRTWDEVVSQEHVVQTLRNAVAGGRVAHAYLFSGPRGTGKTTAARLLAKAVNCLDPDASKRPCNSCAHCVAVNENRFLDLIEIDAASNTSVEDVRDLRDKINFTPSQGKYKIYIIDEVHMLSTAAFNALLKTLEEPPPHAIFILATTEIHKIPATVLSRCQRHEFRRVPVADIVANLKKIGAAEGITADEDALTLIARQSTGSMRDAQSLLDQLASSGEKISLALAQSVLGTATSQTVLDLVEAIRAGESARGMEAIHAALDAGTDPRALARQIVDYLRAVMLIRMGSGEQVEAPAEVRARMAQHAAAFSTTELLRIVRIFNLAATDLRGGWQPALSLELAFAETLESPQLAASPPGPVGPGPATPTPPPPPPKRAAPASRIAAGAPPAPKPKAGTQSGISIEAVNEVWKQVVAAFRHQNTQLEALLNSVRTRDIVDGVLVLGFASDVLREKMEKAEMLEAARQAFAQALGRDIPIRSIVAGATKSAPPDIKPDGMVAAALQNGGEIVDIQ